MDNQIDLELRTELGKDADEVRFESVASVAKSFDAKLRSAYAEIGMRDEIIRSQRRLIEELRAEVEVLKVPAPTPPAEKNMRERLRPVVAKLPQPVQKVTYSGYRLARRVVGR